MPRLEVIATTLHDALEAVAGGAQSLEIIEDLSVGGLTPPLDIVRAIRDAVTIDLNVMIRFHARSFVYTPREMERMLISAQEMARIGVTTVVFGALTADNGVDVTLTRQIADAAKGCGLTFHRALDETHNPTAALESLKGIASRILCSGGAANIWDGRAQMGQWVGQFPEFTFACAGGVTLDNLPELVRITRAQEYHVGTAARTNGIVTRAKVRTLVEALDISR